jgi:hypothetical protein
MILILARKYQKYPDSIIIQCDNNNQNHKRVGGILSSRPTWALLSKGSLRERVKEFLSVGDEEDYGYLI